MNNDRLLKKSLFGGFKREDVLDYIEKLQSENVSLADELREKSAECSDCVSAEEFEALRAENEELKAEIESLKSQIQAAGEKAAADESDYDKFSGEKSGALIQDAMKYSDSLVNGAKDTAVKALETAGGTIKSAAADIRSAGERVTTAQVNLNYSLDAIRQSVDSLIDELSTVSEKICPGE
ncbi:MAG: hypothetical protein IKI78_03955 [Clostridia bacterium]|nr:hypothetical protein [Clostridia bacterium]